MPMKIQSSETACSAGGTGLSAGITTLRYPTTPMAIAAFVMKQEIQ